MINLYFVNHASIIIETKNIKLITDPWLEGTVFNNGWSLIEPTKLNYDDFKSVTHIWFSHEHPDHFNPPNLKRIPKEIRSNITILFHQTIDGKVIQFCNDLGFKNCISLTNQWYELSAEFKILNVPHTDGDSWLCIHANGYTILNVNDCVFETESEIRAVKNYIGTKVDVLLTQFSYANWVGNKEDIKTRKLFADRKLHQLKNQILIFEPTYTIPFASFVWFCHAENYYMNDEINTIDSVYQLIKDRTQSKPIVLFPGDKFLISSFS